ncbi:protein Hook homolog 2-like [Zophobas morio]|uniref:protein Hook homolog 2-like n=1 Tax=Zophobas morio TaxID=2755281 RepID=UPI0030826C8E
MESQFRNYCNPCRCSNNYIYSESIPAGGSTFIPYTNLNPDSTPSKTRSRPSSANSVKSRLSKKTSGDSSKNASSDSKILKPNIPSKVKVNVLKKAKKEKPVVDSDGAKLLKEELEVIKEQLYLLSEQRQNCPQNCAKSDELECLREHCENQEKEIQELKCKNAKLLKKIKKQPVDDIDNAITTKSRLDDYEKKLTLLYDEFVETSKVMELNRERICRCIKEKSDEYEDRIKSMSNSKTSQESVTQEVPETLEDTSKYVEQNSVMAQTIQKLESDLHQALLELETSRKQALTAEKKHQKEITEKNKVFLLETQKKTKEIEDLKAKIQENKSCRCNPCRHKLAATNNELQTKYDQLAHKYKHMVDKLNIYQQSTKKRNEELQMLKQQESNLLAEYVNLQGFCEQLRSVISEHKVTMAQLNSAVHERDSALQCQRAELASKNKQVELLAKSEDRLKKKVIELQENLVSMTVASNSIKRSPNTTTLCAEDCSIHLTQELEDLINALYEEIDKTLEKDEQIQKQAREICCLRCAMSAKDTELKSLRTQLKILQRRFDSTVKGREASFQDAADEAAESAEEDFSTVDL